MAELNQSRDRQALRRIWLQRRVFHWAHQGGAREGPSNTLYAMGRAMANGAHGLELDVHLTADGKIVVAHDNTLFRMTGKPEWTIDGCDLAHLRRLDAAFHWVPGKVDAPRLEIGDEWLLQGQGPANPNLRIPTLDEVIDAFPDTPFNLEIKAGRAAKPLADLLIRRDRTDVIVVAFDDRWVRRFHRHAKTIPIAPGRVTIALFWLLSRFRIALPMRRYTALQVPLSYKGFPVTDKRLVETAHKRQLAVHVWTVDDPNAMHRAIDLGADGIMTDRPSVLKMVLAERGVGWQPGS